MGEVARPAAAQREGFDRRFGIVRLERVERHHPVKFAHQPMQRVERIGGAGRRFLREGTERAVDVRKPALTEIHFRL